MNGNGHFGLASLALGLLCVVSLVISSGCTQQDSRGSTNRPEHGDRPRLGVELSAADNRVAITNVDDDSPAAAAGLQAGDEVISVDGKTIASRGDLRSQVDTAAKNGGTLAIKVRRDGSAQTVQASLNTERDVLAKNTRTGEHSSNESAPSKQVVGDRGTEEDRDPAQQQPDNDQPPAASAGEDRADAAEKRPNVTAQPDDDQPDRPTPSRGDSNNQVEQEATPQPAESRQSSSVASEQQEITLEEVEKELEQAKQMLEGLVAQQNKLEYQTSMKRQLRKSDDRLATLEHEVAQLKQRLSEKERYLDDVQKKREQFVAEIEELDPTTTGSWMEKRKRIDAAWQALQEAYEHGASEDDSDS